MLGVRVNIEGGEVGKVGSRDTTYLPYLAPYLP